MSAAVGRDAELAHSLDWLCRDGAAPVLAIVGEAGIGKTTVLRALRERAEHDGWRTLTARAVAAEAALALATVADLLGPLDAEIATLPEPQRRALDAVLLRDEPEHPPSTRSLATALLGALATSAADRPVLVVIDDAQWLDASSAQVLAFVLRRLPGPVRAVLTVRAQPGEALPPVLDGVEPEVLALGPLGLAALQRLLADALGDTPARPVLVGIERASRGNPLLALELGRATRRGVDPRSSAPGLGELLGARLYELPAATRSALVLLAAAGGEQARAALPLDTELLVPAAAAGIVVFAGDRVHFGHPLHATAVLDGATTDEVRGAHAALAAVATDPEARARHRASAASGPDEDIAGELLVAAARARARGAVAVAAELAAMAVAATPPDVPARGARVCATAEYTFLSGDAGGALEALAPLVAASTGADRARAQLLAARIHHETAGSRECLEAANDALAHAGDDPLLVAEAHVVLSRGDFDDFVRAEGHARTALALLDALPDAPPGLAAQALVAATEAQTLLGRGLDVAAFQRAIALEALDPPVRIADRAAASLGAWAKYCDDLPLAWELLLASREQALLEGDDSSLVYVVSHLPQLALWSGRWDEAEAWAREHLELAEQTGQEGQRLQALYNVALVAAHRGRFEEAERVLDEADELVTRLDDTWFRMTIRATQAFLAFSRGDAAATVALHQDAHALADQASLGEPGYRRNIGDVAEALVAIGRIDDAERIIDALEVAAERAGRRSSSAMAWRSRAVARGVQGRHEEAAELAERAAAVQGEIGLVFEQARSEMVLGTVLRRAKQRARARVHLERALAAFRELGAEGWAANAAEQLDRVQATRRASTELTETERQVAELAAAGLTNREVASRLFLSPKTVEANLTRAYQKLGISSRAALGAWFVDSRSIARDSPDPREGGGRSR